ncbi:amidohydrolase family protein [Streptomyces wuyuanensis]|uniref:amidohydrolase family protein n=1 Tax=Streptomyces wuyuanensis TaxID=1196353 RepID=UPI003434F4EE
MGSVPPIFDAHLHIIDERFPLVPNAGYLPLPFTAEDYLARARDLGVTAGAVVSGSFQAFDQSYLIDALNRLGAGFVGVTQLPSTAADHEIRVLDDAGVRAVRLNLYRGGSETVEHLERTALRVHDLAGWHVELYVDLADAPQLAGTLERLPRVSIDHLGMSTRGLPHLLRLVEHGVRVKATGFSRGDLDVPQALQAICDVDPHALMFGTDLPSTRAQRPFTQADLDLVNACLPASQARRVLYTNAVHWYRPAGF